MAIDIGLEAHMLIAFCDRDYDCLEEGANDEPRTREQKILIALIGCAGPVLAAVISGILLLISKNPPTPTPTVAPTEVILADRMTVPTAEARTTAAPTPEQRPATCPEGLVCRHDDFDTLDRNLWCARQRNGARLEGQMPAEVSFADGEMVITAPEATAIELRPCPDQQRNLKFVELWLAIEEASGEPFRVGVGFGNSLDEDRYAYLNLDAAGDAHVFAGVHGQSSDTVSQVPLEGLNDYHTLRIEWGDDRARFFVDGQAAGDGLGAASCGFWFLINASATTDSSVTVRFDRVERGLAAP